MYARHAVGDGDGGKASAVRKNCIIYARHAVGDGDGLERRAAPESTSAYGRHAVGDGDGGKTGAAIVFASRFISTICVLNGRKVMPRILKKPKKINI